MNARIQELIAQATTVESYYPAGCNGYHEDRYSFDKEKFAQLIVRECAEVGFDSVNAGHSIDYLKNHVCYNILNYFGVER